MVITEVHVKCGHGHPAFSQEQYAITAAFVPPDDQEDVADEDHPAGGYPEDVIGEDGKPGDPEVGKAIGQGEIIDREGEDDVGRQDGEHGPPLPPQQARQGKKKVFDQRFRTLFS